MNHSVVNRTDVAVVNEMSEVCLFNNQYGHFDVPTAEFIITDILTPRPWVNVMSNGRYGLVLSQLGGGFSWLDNSQLARITRWEQDLALDAYGRWLYIADSATEEVYSTTFAPVRKAALDEDVRHGLGYSIFNRRHSRFETTQTVFVSEGTNAEHTIVEIRSLSDTPLNLVLGSYLEWFLGGQGDWHREFHRLFTSIEIKENMMFAWKRLGLQENRRDKPEPSMVAFASVVGLQNVEWFADKAQWIGPEGRMDRPGALLSDRTPVNTGRWDDPIAAFRSPLNLQPGSEVRFALTVGAEDAREDIVGLTLAQTEDQFKETRDFHRKRCYQLNFETSDPALDIMCNAWLPYQAEVGRMKARCAYYQQGGAFGFRDQLQDSLMLLDTNPETTLGQLSINAEAMYEDGGVRHWWHPNTTIFAPSRHSDTCLWLAHGVLEYLEETANLAVLNESRRFLNRDTELAGNAGTLLEHCERGIARFLEQRSPRGLPLICSGDWNDGLSHAGIDGKGESIWLAMFGFQILNRLALVYEMIGEAERAATSRNEAQNLRQAVEAYGWDGDWYMAGTSDDGRPFGSQDCIEGKIFLNPQTWAAITGIGSQERTQKALEAVRTHLLKPYGALLLSPAYQEVDPYIGYITRYAPGLRENGGVYSHASTWAVQAFAQNGDAQTAYSIFRGMLPPLRAARDAVGYQAEPYVMPGNVDGPDSPYEGRAGWTWYTGSAAYMRRIALHWLLGVRPNFDGLIVDPKLASELGPIRLRRSFRGDVFDITIETGEVAQIWLDGETVEPGPMSASGENLPRTLHVTTLR